MSVSLEFLTFQSLFLSSDFYKNVTFTETPGDFFQAQKKVYRILRIEIDLFFWLPKQKVRRQRGLEGSRAQNSNFKHFFLKFASVKSEWSYKFLKSIFGGCLERNARFWKKKVGTPFWGTNLQAKIRCGGILGGNILQLRGLTRPWPLARRI